MLLLPGGHGAYVFGHIKAITAPVKGATHGASGGTAKRPAPEQGGVKPPANAKAQASAKARATHVSTNDAQPVVPVRTYVGDFLVTCYDLTGHTATGALVSLQSVAVDPSVIPLGTQIYVPGAGLRTADDTGGLIIGHRLDIWEPTYADCANWGAEEKPVYTVNR